jgi:hypothetical protein
VQEDIGQRKVSFSGDELKIGQVGPHSADAERMEGHQPGDVLDNHKVGTTHQDGKGPRNPCTARGSEGG